MADEADIIRKVQALWAQADDPATPAEARPAFVAKARELMAKHAIDEMVLAEAGNGEEQIVLADILLYTFDEGKNGQQALVPDQRVHLANYIYTHHRCKGVLDEKRASIREDGTKVLAGKYLVVIGYKSDVDMVRLMYFALAGDMIIAMSMEDTSHMGAVDRRNYLKNFCDGYADRIRERLAETEVRVEQMAAESNLLPVLVSRKDKVEKRMKEIWPNLRTTYAKSYSFDSDARRRGRAAADKANIGASQKGVGGRRPELNGG